MRSHSKPLELTNNHNNKEPVKAATVVLLRNSANGLETLMLRKNSKLAFGGMWVFPGGKVDPSDRKGLDGGVLNEISTARNAAVREAKEEASILIDGNSMVMFAFWLPPEMFQKRYATWFFAAKVPDRTPHENAVVVDQGEIVEGEWMTPNTCLQRHQDGDIELAPPTWVTLERLRLQSSAQKALNYLSVSPPRYHITRMANSDLGPVALWAGDAGYLSLNPDLRGKRNRLEMFHSGYRYLYDLEHGDS